VGINSNNGTPIKFFVMQFINIPVKNIEEVKFKINSIQVQYSFIEVNGEFLAARFSLISLYSIKI
jgi:hypothetical protein